MKPERRRSLIQEIVQKDKYLSRIMSHLIDVLRVYMFIVDQDGKILWESDHKRYGATFLLDHILGCHIQSEHTTSMKHFHRRGHYFECGNHLFVHCFSIPIFYDTADPIGYIIIGPVVLNKRLSNEEYRKIADQHGIPAQQFIDTVSEIKVVSNLMMNSILDLIKEITEDNIKNFVKTLPSMEGMMPSPGSASGSASAISAQELLEHVLAVALQMTNAECGSIMLIDSKRKELEVRAIKGVDLQDLPQMKVKLGEGLAGLVAQEKNPILISEDQTDERIAHLLKRPEIKKSFIMPLCVKDQLLGVLNLHSKRSKNVIKKKSIEFLPYLANLLSPILN
ncbi:MAG: GAF domain-containing protein [Candidatus Omnitrophica bacterium]|nr:GAF domain-containing protein [Candidatus Omnitrophota bacterium]